MASDFQSAVVCHERQKTPILRHLFETKAGRRVIVFAASKLKVKELNRELRRAGYKSAEMHSDLEQDRRDEVMQDFRSARIDVLVATDILARGIDIDDIAMVVNYDVPREAEDYVHRIGRTARANAGGIAITLVAGGKEQQKFKQIERFLKKEILKNPLPEGMCETPSRSNPGNAKNNPGSKKRYGKPRNNHRKGAKDKPAKTSQQPAAERP